MNSFSCTTSVAEKLFFKIIEFVDINQLGNRHLSSVVKKPLNSNLEIILKSALWLL